MFQFLDTYEGEPPEAVPNEEWYPQRYLPISAAIESTRFDVSSTLCSPISERDNSRTSSSESSYQNRKPYSLERVKKSYAASLISRKRFPRFENLNSALSGQGKNRVHLIHQLVDHFDKSGKSFSFGLDLFLKRIAPKLFNESGSLSAIPKEGERRKNSASQTMLKTLVRYRALNKLYMEHVNRLKVVFKPDLFLQRVISKYIPTGLDDPNGDNGLLKGLMQNVERAGSALEHLDMEIEAFAAAHFHDSNKFKNSRSKTFVRIATIRELGLKAPSSMQVVQAIRNTHQRSSFLEKVKVVSGLIEHRILNHMVNENLNILIKAMDTLSYLDESESDGDDERHGVRLVKSARTNRSSLSHFNDNDRNKATESTMHHAMNEFNVSTFSSLAVKKFKDFVIKQVSKELSVELKSIFTVPFMVPYAEKLTSDINLTEMIIYKVKDMLKLLKLPKLFATFRASSEPDEEMRHATRIAEEKLIKATVPILLNTGNTLIKRFAITGANRPRKGIRSPIRKSTNMGQKNQRSNKKDQRKLKVQRVLADSDDDEFIPPEKTAMNYIVKNIIDEDLKTDEVSNNTLLSPRTTSKVLAGCVVDDNSNNKH